MLRVLVGNSRRNFLTNAGFPLMMEMDQIGRQMVLLLLWQFRQLGLDLLQAHGQIVADRKSGASTPSMSKFTTHCFTARSVPYCVQSRAPERAPRAMNAELPPGASGLHRLRR